MAGDDVPPEAAPRRHGPLQVHPAADGQAPQGGAVQGLVHDVGGEACVIQTGGGQADAVHRHAVPQLQVGEHRHRADGEHRRAGPPPDGADYAHLLNDSRKQGRPPRFPIKNLPRRG